ncbi:RmlC-like cupin, partial [Sporormia fimetaria CBS 119925]
VPQLLTQGSALKRFKLLLTSNGKLKPESEIAAATVFDFNAASAAPNAKGGRALAANIDTFPLLTDLGISTTVAFLSPCGLNTPHVHPRATEFLTLVSGSLTFGSILENGLVDPGQPAEIRGRLQPFQGTAFPVGSIHYQFNPSCDTEAVFVASLNNEDPGTNQVAQGFLGLDGGVVNATLGFPKTVDGRDLEGFRKMIPANLALDVESCLRRC